MGLGHQLQFLKRYVRDPNVLGAVAPSSRSLASALCEPYHRCSGPAKVLEVGAGTGAITRYLGSVLGEEDELDICEVHSGFADILERDVLSDADFAQAVVDGRVRLLRTRAQDIDHECRYDFVISGLPLTAFELRDVRDIMTVIRRCLKPDGVLSYFEYVGLRRSSRALALGRRRARVRLVSRYLSEQIRMHQFARRTVLRNLPPAYARHLRFDAPVAIGTF